MSKVAIVITPSECLQVEVDGNPIGKALYRYDEALVICKWLNTNLDNLVQ